VIAVEELAWKLEEAADKLEEWAFWTTLSVKENIENLWDRVSEIPQALSDYFQDIGFRLEDLANLSARVQEWWEEQRAYFQEALERMGAQIKEVGAWLSENAEKVALGVGVAGVSLGVAGLGPERIHQDVQRFFQGTVVAVQELKEGIAAFHEEVERINASAKEIMGEVRYEFFNEFSFSSKGATFYEKFNPHVDPSYGEKADPKGGPEPW
jgi:methyl-accepting chemotaxis protein